MELWTISETAEKLGVSTKTVRQWIRSGHLRAVRLGPRVVRVVPGDVHEAMVTIRPDQADPR